MKKFINRIIGNQDEFRLKHRLLNGILVILCSSLAIASIGNWLMLTNFFAAFITSLAAILFIPIIYLSRIKGWFKLPALVLLICCMSILGLMWFSNGGVNGSNPNLTILITLLIVVLFSSWQRYTLMVILLIFVAGLIGFEYKYPELVVPYANREEHFLDMMMAVILGSIVAFMMMAMVIRGYNDERMEVSRLARIDSLTEVANRRHFKTVVDAEIARSIRYQHPLSMLLIDVDHFKELNDNFGHSKGDEILKTIARKLKENSRNSDFIARWGGEEFVILAPETSSQNAMVIAEKHRRLIKINDFGISQNITISVGVTEMTEKDNQDTFFHRADIALYTAKNSGRDCVKNA
jgi:diguanylate cyclase (GGDEF)-like protein